MLSETDLLLMLDVYAAGEQPIPGADTRSLCRSIRQRGVEPVFVESTDDLSDLLKTLLRPGDLLLTQGAGDITSLAHRLSQLDLREPVEESS